MGLAQITTVPSSSGHHKILKIALFDTKLGQMVAIADEQFLYLLDFVDSRGLGREVERLGLRMKAAIIPGSTKPLNLIKQEIVQYFGGQLKKFNTPFIFLGTPFQQKVWQVLQKISYGETTSYAQIAKAIDNPSAFRAVARANGANKLSIIIPCHRIINSNGELGGYGGGISRKQWLLKHESST